MSSEYEQRSAVEAEAAHTGRAGDLRETAECGTRRKSGAYAGAGAGEGAMQIIIRRAVVAGKFGAAQLEDGFHLRRGDARRQQFLGNPEVCDTPIRMGKALRNPQAVQPGLIDGTGRWHGNGWGSGRRGGLRRPRGNRGGQRQPAPGRAQQRAAVASQTWSGPANFHPGSQAAGQAPLWFLIGESCQSAHMTPIGAGAVALIPARQLSADGAGYRRRQRLGAHLHPSLQMARAGVNHYAGLMAMGAHGIQHGGRGLVQIHENVAGAIGKGVGLKVHIISVTVARAQKSYDGFPTKLSRGPQPGAGESSAGVMVNQADEVALPRHGRELAVNGFQRKRQSAIQNDSCPRPLRRLGWGVGSERKGAPYGETLQATGRTTRVFNRPKRVCADALPTNSVASALPHQEARFLGGHHQPTMASATGYGKGDISTLLWRGHFYFALTFGVNSIDSAAMV